MKIVGIYGIEGTPVPIPNTEVKLNSVEDTWMATSRENRTVPTLIFLHSSVGRAHDCVHAVFFFFFFRDSSLLKC